MTERQELHVVEARRARGPALLVPYPAWVGLAVALNTAIALGN